jgi:hypothetical protein
VRQFAFANWFRLILLAGTCKILRCFHILEDTDTLKGGCSIDSFKSKSELRFDLERYPKVTETEMDTNKRFLETKAR